MTTTETTSNSNRPQRPRYVRWKFTVTNHETHLLQETSSNGIVINVFTRYYKLYISPICSTPTLHREGILYAEGSSLSPGQARKILHHVHPQLTVINLERCTLPRAQEFLKKHWNISYVDTILKPLPTWNLIVIC